MSKHDEARENISFMDNKYDKAYKEMKRYITDMEAMEKHFIESEKKMRDDYFELLKKHNELKHDVKRYFELSHNPRNNKNPNEIRPFIEWAKEVTDLEKEILSKVGDEK
jgi:Xaa-Pro aminopeptidase